LLVETARQQPVESISNSGHHKYGQRPNKLLVKKQRNEDGNQRHPKDGQQIRQGDNSRGHLLISDFGFAIAD
jgi:hypothetical protein